MIWLTVLAMLLAANVHSQSGIASHGAELQILHNVFCSVPYANFRVDVYEHVDNQTTTTQSSKKYFYAPIALLDHQSASCVYNKDTQQNEMRFRVDMWNDKIEHQVIEYLTNFMGQQVNATQVQVVPLENVALTTNGTSTICKLRNDWVPYRKSMWFNLSCLLQKTCNQLATEMRTNPSLFEHLKLLYSPGSTASQTFANTQYHDIHLVRDSAPTADDWAQLVANHNDTSKQLNEMKVMMGALGKTLNESKSIREEVRKLPEIARRSSETMGRLTDTNITVQVLKNQLADITQQLDVTKQNFTEELNENKIAIESLKKELVEINRRSEDNSMQLRNVKAEWLKEAKEWWAGLQTTTSRPTTSPTPQFDCTGKTNGTYANPASKCSSIFYTCSNGKAATSNCPPGTVYHPKKKECLWITNVEGCPKPASR
ncbi:uncharacterized protein LOC130698054 [Daphnia carinata]|uniref:uncharacterized protein LOC130698054 n=1 Tax=Daphnia carinata TaxID=120202 RepID=UPI00257A4FB9|nr:uncharacterized protein LOC130698054 [Daphnia carinata]